MQQRQREFEYTRDDFDFLRNISNQHSGIIAAEDKYNMFYSRLSRRLRVIGLANFKEYCSYLEKNYDQEFTEFINAITTNLTAFFRENHHFEYLENTVIPSVLKRNSSSRCIKVWSAGCSTGEEPYSIAMTLMEHVPAGWDIKILATDLDTSVLETAANGVYSRDRVDGLLASRLKRWFQKGKGKQQNRVKIKSELSGLIRFKHLNLMTAWPMKEKFDFIFCRNVLIYFDNETKQNLAKKYSNFLNSGSCLFIGHSESLQQLPTDFELIGKTIYRKI